MIQLIERKTVCLSLGLICQELYISSLTKSCWPTFSFSPFFRPFSCSFLHHHHDHCSVSHNSHYHYALSHFCIYHAPPNHHQTALHQPQDDHSRTSHHHSIQGPHNHSLAEEQTGGPRPKAMWLPALPSRWNLWGGGQWLHLHLSCRKRRSCVRERWGELQKICALHRWVKSLPGHILMTP